MKRKIFPVKLGENRTATPADPCRFQRTKNNYHAKGAQRLPLATYKKCEFPARGKYHNARETARGKLNSFWQAYQAHEHLKKEF